MKYADKNKVFAVCPK